MSRTAVREDETTGAGKGAVAAIFVVATALVLLLMVRARPAPEPFDPRSSASDGATALVEVLERSGADVTITRTPSAPGDGSRMLILVDDLSVEQRAATLAFVVAGGLLVVADPGSELHGGQEAAGANVAVTAFDLPQERRSVGFEANVRPGRCTIGALDRLRGLYVPDGVLFPVGVDDPQCFSDDGQSFVIVRALGDGTVVGLGDNEGLVNRHLRRADNAGLATALLAPEPGGEVVILLGTGTAAAVSDVGEGEDTLFDLVPSWVWMTIVLGAVAFVMFAVSRSVRVGKVLDEPLATPIAGSELVAATGNLMQRAKHASRAGSLLQMQLHRDLCREYHVDMGAPLADIDRAVVARAGITPGTIDALLREPAASDAQLLALSSRIDHIRKEVLT